VRLLYVVNKQLPEGDYRLVYGQQSQLCNVIYALPGKPSTLPVDHFVAVNFGEGLQPAYLAELVRLYAYLRRHRSDINLAHLYSTNLILLGPLAARLAGVPSMITLTGFGRTFTSPQRRYQLLRPIYWVLLRVAIGLSRATLFQNHADMQGLAGRFPRLTGRFFYAGSAVSTPVVQDKAFTSEPLRVLLVARLMPDKGIEDFLHIAEVFDHQRVEFILVGPPSLGFEALSARVQDYHRLGIITYLGELDTRATYEQMADAHVFLFPSYGEGMARVMLEAGFALTCPVAYDIPANQDLITDGRGFLLPVGACKEAAAVIRRLAEDRVLVEAHARRYQTHVTANFSMEVFAKRIDDVMAAITGRTSEGGLMPTNNTVSMPEQAQ
jgi:glycosyltransferase involved in cell wall biosynthesis